MGHEDAVFQYRSSFLPPILHVNKGLSLDTIIASAVKGMKRAKEEYLLSAANHIMSKACSQRFYQRRNRRRPTLPGTSKVTLIS